MIKVKRWLDDNILSLNVDKTVSITFGNYIDSIPKTFTIKIDNNIIERVNHVKYLGIIVDQHFRWNFELNSRVKRLKYTVLVLAKLRRILSHRNLISIMYGIYYSIATYGIIAWGSAVKTYLKGLQSIHEKVIKVLNFNEENSSGQPLDIKQKYLYESLLYHYEELSNKYISKCENILYPIFRRQYNLKFDTHLSVDICLIRMLL